MIEQARDYFASLNPLARKIFQEVDVLKQSKGESWEKLTEEEQDSAIDNHFVDNAVREKYDNYTQSDEYPSSFPQLKVASGEKIVVDFDKDVSVVFHIPPGVNFLCIFFNLVQHKGGNSLPSSSV